MSTATRHFPILFIGLPCRSAQSCLLSCWAIIAVASCLLLWPTFVFCCTGLLMLECGKPVYRQGHVLRVGRLRGFRAWTDADHLELDSFAVEAFGARGRRASAPSLRPMPSCTTTSSPRAAGKKPTRKAAPLEARASTVHAALAGVLLDGRSVVGAELIR